MGLRTLGVLAVVVLAACATPPSSPMTVESAEFPDVRIECGGEPGLGESECLAWAEQMLSTAAVDATKLVLTYRTGNARCAADYFAADGLMLMTVAARCPDS